MQKKIVALAVAGLSTAAFAQTNVTIYGVADVSGQGISASQGKAVNDAAGNVFALQSNSSLLGFKGSEDLGNGLKAMFQYETGVNLTGSQASANDRGTSSVGGAAIGGASLLAGQRDTFLGLSSKYGNVMAGFISTPFRSSLTSFAVEPGATGSMTIEKQMGAMRFGYDNVQFASSVRATAIAYAMPTLYGFDASIAYTGSNNNGTTNSTTATGCTNNTVSACTVTPQSAFGFNLGWTGYGVNIKGAFQQANNNVTNTAYGDYTSYLVGAIYTGLPGLKASVVYNRNTLGTNGTTATVSDGAAKLTNNQLYTGVSYRMGNWEPAVSAVFNSDVNGAQTQQLGSRQWQARVGYYLSKRTQAYGLISNLNNSANQNYTFGQQTSQMGDGATGMNLFTYGLGMRTSF
jgi:predicted porin